jgi:outer membrane protein
MNLKTSALTAFAFMWISLPVMATDLLETFHAAQSQDSVFAAARNAQRAGQEKLTQGRASLLPTVNLTANTTYNDNKNNTVSPSQFSALTVVEQRYNSNGYGISFVQPLFRHNNWQLYSSSELQVAQSEAQFKNAEQDLILRAAQAYFDVLAAQDGVSLTEAQKSAIGEQLAQAKRNFEVGSATITDTLEAQARYDLINAQAIAAQSNLEIKERTLQQLTNAPPKSLQGLGPNFKLDMPQPSNADKWVEQAQQGNLQLVVAQASAELADKEVVRNRGGHYPTIDLVATYNKNNANPNGGPYGTGLDTTNAAVGVQLNFPLFQGGATQSRWREAEANRDRANAEVESARRNVDLQTRQAYTGVVNGIGQIMALEQALKSSEKLLEASKLGHEVGVRTNIDVLNAQQQLYATRRDLSQARYNYLISRLRLKAATGSLAEDELAVVNQALH